MTPLSEKCHLIYGPPGTGKTTRLLDIVEQEIRSGVPANKIAFCSFTKKSVEEAIDRVIDRFNFSTNDLVYFKTVHSLSFHATGLKREQVLQLKDYRKIGEHLGVTFSSKFDDLSETTSQTKHRGSQYQYLHGFARARKISFEEMWNDRNPENLNWYEFIRYVETVTQYKKMKGLIDFQDMLDTHTVTVPVDVLIIDEAQDLSTAQWAFLEPTIQHAKRVYVGGDDDQAIFAWGGADVTHFIDMKGEREILSQSHRVPEEIYALSSDISKRIEHRTDKAYKPKAEKGSVNYWTSPDHVDLTEGTWMLLARNSYLLGELVNVAKEQGVAYSVRGYSSISGEHTRVIKLWEKWRNDPTLELSDVDIALIEQYLPNDCTVWPREKIWHEALVKMHTVDREYYISLLRRKESLSKKPRVNITTIHGSKGGEADNVLLLTDMAYSTWNASNPDDEHRVWYVGATRAKKNLHVVMPRGRYYYTL